jgi:AbrB family looped-hinge helix DNA binding protein
MKKLGIVKEIDSLGRLHIPKEIRKRLGLNKSVELVLTDAGLLIKSKEYQLIKIKDTEK